MLLLVLLVLVLLSTMPVLMPRLQEVWAGVEGRTGLPMLKTEVVLNKEARIAAARELEERLASRDSTVDHQLLALLDARIEEQREDKREIRREQERQAARDKEEAYRQRNRDDVAHRTDQHERQQTMRSYYDSPYHAPPPDPSERVLFLAQPRNTPTYTFDLETEAAQAGFPQATASARATSAALAVSSRRAFSIQGSAARGYSSGEPSASLPASPRERAGLTWLPTATPTPRVSMSTAASPRAHTSPPFGGGVGSGAGADLDIHSWGSTTPLGTPLASPLRSSLRPTDRSMPPSPRATNYGAMASRELKMNSALDELGDSLYGTFDSPRNPTASRMALASQNGPPSPPRGPGVGPGVFGALSPRGLAFTHRESALRASYHDGLSQLAQTAQPRRTRHNAAEPGASDPAAIPPGGFARKTVRVYTGFNPTDGSPKAKSRATPPAAARRLLLGSPRANAEGERPADRWNSPREMPAGVPHASPLLS